LFVGLVFFRAIGGLMIVGKFWFLSLFEGNCGAAMKFILLFPFLVKLPLYRMHFWLPKAHVEAPVFGSVVLARVLLKSGGYGVFLMFIFFKGGTILYLIFMLAVSLFITLVQRDLKELVAYSSVFHMSYVYFLISIELSQRFSIRFYLLLTHRLSSSLFFIFVRELFYLCGTRNAFLVYGLLKYFYIMVGAILVLLYNLGTPVFLSFFL